MADFCAFVRAAAQRFVAEEAACEGRFVTGNGFALLVLAVAPFCGEDDAGRASRVRVAGMQDFVIAGMGARTGPGADGTLRATWNWGVDDGGTAFAEEFVEADAITGEAVAAVAG